MDKECNVKLGAGRGLAFGKKLNVELVEFGAGAVVPLSVGPKFVRVVALAVELSLVLRVVPDVEVEAELVDAHGCLFGDGTVVEVDVVDIAVALLDRKLSGELGAEVGSEVDSELGIGRAVNLAVILNVSLAFRSVTGNLVEMAIGSDVGFGDAKLNTRPFDQILKVMLSVGALIGIEVSEWRYAYIEI